MDLVERMARSTGSEITITQAPANPSQAKILYRQLSLQFNNILTKFISRLKKQGAGTLPHHNRGTAVAAASPSPGGSSQQPMLHVFSCKHADRFRKSLLQDRVDSITCDRSLFAFMRERHSRSGLRSSIIPSLNEVRGIFFVKFRLPLGELY